MSLLYVLRHAKSSWVDPGLDDRDRPLAPRGRRDAERVATFLRREGIAPALVLCSSSLRTRETLAAILPSLEGGVEVLIEEGLYGAEAAELLGRLRALPDPVPSVLLIGHNPGLHELVLSLLGHARDLGRLAERFPTAALATLAIPHARWPELDEGDAELVGFVVPRELT